MPLGMGDGLGGGRSGFDDLNSRVKSRTRSDPIKSSDPIRPGKPPRRLAKALVALVVAAAIIVVLLLAL